MNLMKKTVSILLAIMLVVSVFTIIPMTASAEEAPVVTLTQWVEAYQEEQGMYSFEGLYDNFLFSRVNPDKDPSTESNPWANDVVYNQTNNLSMTGNDGNFAKNDRQKYHLDNYYSDGSNKMWGYWLADDYFNDADTVYLEADYSFENGCNFWAYTWKDVTLTKHDQAAPTFDETNGYQNGTTQDYYTGGGLYFVYDADNDAYVQIAAADLFTVRYFEYEYLSTDNTIRLNKCNSADANVIVPDEIPEQYYPAAAPAGTTCTIINHAAFANLDTLETVTIGDNVESILGKKGSKYKGAFYNCAALESVSVGAGLSTVGAACFKDCVSLTSFETSSTENGIFTGVSDIASENDGLTVRCYHDSGIARYLNGGYTDFVTVDYLDQPVVHTYEASDWDWSSFDAADGTGDVTAYVACAACGEEVGTLTADISQVVDTPATCSTEGSGHYVATIEYGDQTFTNDHDGDFTYTIPVDSDTHDYDWENGTWYWYGLEGFDYDNPYDYFYFNGSVHAEYEVTCHDCGQAYQAQADVTFDYFHAPGNCLQNYEAGFTAVCRDDPSYTDTKEIIGPVGEHSLVHHPAVDPTPSADGNIEYWQCELCSKYFSDQGATEEISQADTVIEKTGVARIDNVYYDSFSAAATEALSAGNLTVVLIKDIADAYTMPVNSAGKELKVEKAGHSLTVNAPADYELSETTSGGVTTYSISSETAETFFPGHSLTLDGDIGVNFFVDLDADQLNQDPLVTFTWTGKYDHAESVSLTAANLDPKGSGYYIATCSVCAAEMTCPITATLLINGEAVEENVYTVKDYAEVILDSSYANDYEGTGSKSYDNLKNLVQAMLDYGTMAQKRFEVRSAVAYMLANNGVNFFDQAPDWTTVADGDSMDYVGNGLVYTGSAVNYLNKCGLRHYFMISNTNAFSQAESGITFGGQAVTKTKSDEEIYFELKNIAPAEYDVQQAFVIGEDTYNYSVLYYSKKIAQSSNDINSQNLAKATYWYNHYAKTYFA